MFWKQLNAPRMNGVLKVIYTEKDGTNEGWRYAERRRWQIIF